MCKPPERCKIEASGWRKKICPEKNRSPEEKARRAKIRELLQMVNIPSMVTIMEISVYLEITKG